MPTYAGKNNTSARQNASFVTNAINELLLNNCIEEIPNCPRIVNPLSVSTQPSGKQHLILDLRHVNQCLYKEKFKCEDIKTIVSLTKKDYFLFNFDLKSAYHHVEICPDHRQYLCFAWEFSPQVTRYFQFCVLPFGLSSAPYLFTKLLQPLLKKWRQQGIPIAVYLHDGIRAGKNILVVKRNSLIVHADLIKAGFLVNEKKSNWEPVQEIVWLGYTIGTHNNTIAVTERQVCKLNSCLDELLNLGQGYMPVKKLASVIGQIISLQTAAGNIIPLMTRSAYSLINSCNNWQETVCLDSATKTELLFWHNNITVLNSKEICDDNIIPSVIVYSDASANACGAILNVHDKVFHTNWSDDERTKSSTWRELQTVYLAIQAFTVDLYNRTIAWFTDNQNVPFILSCNPWRSNCSKFAYSIVFP